jgi:hypothetical protein
MSARQLWRQLGLGFHKSAWLLCGKLRRAMAAPDRSPLKGLVEVDETMLIRPEATAEVLIFDCGLSQLRMQIPTAVVLVREAAVTKIRC